MLTHVASSHSAAWTMNTRHLPEDGEQNEKGRGTQRFPGPPMATKCVSGYLGFVDDESIRAHGQRDTGDEPGPTLPPHVHANHVVQL